MDLNFQMFLPFYKKTYISCNKCESQLEASYFVVTTYHVWNIVDITVKGQCHEIFRFWFFSSISFPPAPEYPIRTV
jgi:hypothetical protein